MRAAARVRGHKSGHYSAASPEAERQNVRRLIVALTVAFVALAGTTVAGAASDAGPLSKITVEGNERREAHAEVRHAVRRAEDGLGRDLRREPATSSPRSTKVTFDFVVVDGRTGKEIGSSFGTTPASAVLDKATISPGFVDGLLGASVGSRVLVAIAPKEGLAKSLQTSRSQEERHVPVPHRRQGREDSAHLCGRRSRRHRPPRLPAVQLDKSTGKPAITVTGTDVPTSLVTQPLIKGTGARSPRARRSPCTTPA